jgi:hypothetical protein
MELAEFEGPGSYPPLDSHRLIGKHPLFRRPADFLNSGRDERLQVIRIFFNVFIDGKPLAAMGSGEQLVIWLKPGIYAFGVTTGESWQIVPALYGNKPPTSFIGKIEMDARPDRLYDISLGSRYGAFVFESVSAPKSP